MSDKGQRTRKHDHEKQRSEHRYKTTLTVELIPPSQEQLDTATDRLADLLADLWVRGLLSEPKE